MRFICVLILLLSFGSLAAQDKLLLMNGNRLEVKVINKVPSKVVFEREKRNGKVVLDSLATPAMFSVTRAGVEDVVYVMDPILGDNLTEDEMRYYLYGRGDGREGYSAWPTMAAGFALGAGGTIAMEGGVVPAVALPLAFGFGMQIPIVRIKEETITDMTWKQYPTYLEGYNKSARNKKFIGAFMSTLVGSLVGSGIILLTE